MPYALHPLRVGASLWRFGDDAVIAGMLHDVVEDTHCELDDLRIIGASQAVVDAVASVTKADDEKKGVNFYRQVDRALGDRIGAWVKAADMEDNAGRLDGVEDLAVRSRLEAQYRAGRDRLAAGLPGYTPDRPLFPPDGW
jgi:(p)ppGpp synthase/HD superfamily hydrolase